MDEEKRPNPEDLLKAIRLEEVRKKRGRLKIFLGMAAGVGKTFTMLEEAHRLNLSEVYIVSGTIDTHGREDTEKLLAGLHHIPEKWIKYKESVFEELDLDKILEVKPQLVLVDELAHSNIPGSRHLKRWQDVEELLTYGIDVYTTLNVQHIESLKDTVEKITGIVVRETIPDSIVDSATFVQIIDITPKELLERLQQGKVYLGEQSIRAAENFFQEDKLTALRQLLLRYGADKVERDLHQMLASQGKIESWRIREKLLVAVSQRSHGQRLIRTAKRLANQLYAPWIALYVDLGKPLTPSEESTISKNLALARDLNAEVLTTTDSDVAGAIARVASQKNVSQILLGSSPQSLLFHWVPRDTILNKVANLCPDVDIHIIRRSTTDKKEKEKRVFATPRFSQLLSYVGVFLWMLTLTAGLGYFFPHTDYQVIGLAYLFNILVMSLFLRRGPLYAAGVLSAVLWNYFFIPLEGSLLIATEGDIVLIALFLLGAFLTGELAERARKYKEKLLNREQTTLTLYEIARVIASSPSTKQILLAVEEKLYSLFGGTCDILLKNTEGSLDLTYSQEIHANPQETAAAIWVFDNSKEAGFSTKTLPSEKRFYLPIKGYSETVGVLAFKPKDQKELSQEEKNLLYTVAQLLGSYIERSLAEERKHKLEYIDQAEKFYQLILSLISNQFQTPLNIIRIAISELKNDKALKDQASSMKALYRIEYALGQLVHVTENISIMAKISAGIAPVKKEKHRIKDLVDACIENVAPFTTSHKMQVHIAPQLPEIEFDFSLIETLFTNLIFNALENSPPHSLIEITAKKVESTLLLSVADEGKGIPEESLDAIFEKFYRLPGTDHSSLGLGLSLAKSIAEIHGGNLKVENRPTGGTKFTLFLPL